MAGWLTGRDSVTRRYCIKTAKVILKLFRTPGSSIILDSSDPCADTQFQDEPTPSAEALNTPGWENLAIFMRFSTDIAVYLENGAR